MNVDKVISDLLRKYQNDQDWCKILTRLSLFESRAVIGSHWQGGIDLMKEILPRFEVARYYSFKTPDTISGKSAYYYATGVLNMYLVLSTQDGERDADQYGYFTFVDPNSPPT